MVHTVDRSRRDCGNVEIARSPIPQSDRGKEKGTGRCSRGAERERLDEKRKNWKFAIGDLRERERWDYYMDAYEEMVQRTATADAPWYVVPADNKWFTRLIVAAAIVDTLQSLDLQFPKVTAEKKKELAAARAALNASDA